MKPVALLPSPPFPAGIIDFLSRSEEASQISLLQDAAAALKIMQLHSSSYVRTWISLRFLNANCCVFFVIFDF